jgi:hypothetical protein
MQTLAQRWRRCRARRPPRRTTLCDDDRAPLGDATPASRSGMTASS